MLQLGDDSPAVRAWQRIVGAHADGRFGPETDVRVRSWQAAHGVEPDGIIGPLTRAELAPGALIKPYEGLRLHAYDDRDSRLPGGNVSLVAGAWMRADGHPIRGYPTIAWGRRLWPGEHVETCTREEADRWFDEALAATYLPAVRRLVTGDPGQACAAASFAYNAGTGALAKLATTGFSEVQWMSIVHSKGVIDAGLVMRRAEEWALWAGGLVPA